jgi:hypothetical protein
MKPKQLTNVLTKLIGLTMCAHSFVPAIGAFIALWKVSQPHRDFGTTFEWSYFLLGVIPFVIGIAFILFSRQTTDVLFKDEA